MKIFLNLTKRDNLPDVTDLTTYIWDNNKSISRAGDSIDFRKCTSLALAWDKWIDDTRWSCHPKFKEYIYFWFLHTSPNNSTLIIEIDDDAVFVDKRAYFRAIEYIAEQTNAKINLGNELDKQLEDYLYHHQTDKKLRRQIHKLLEEQIQKNKVDFIERNEFHQLFKEYLETTFSDAIDRSLANFSCNTV